MLDKISIESINNQIVEIANKYGTAKVFQEKLAELLLRLATEKDFWIKKFKPAEQDEELLYLITIEENSEIALYLVSDSAEITSPPHCHHTWAIIAGISGVEVNHIYTIINNEQKKVKVIRSISIGPGDVAIFNEDDIHSTEVDGLQSTYHLHLYGRKLTSLPDFTDRTFCL
jgi:predicted metal-dependent enzyme (double-stranded beta helix superfamily)